MLLLLTSLFMDILFYLLNPRAAFAHLVAIGLLVDIYKLNGLRASLVIALFEEIFILLLWLLIPNSWATIISIALCIFIYEQLIGPRVEIKDDAIFYSEDSIEDILGKDLNYQAFSIQSGCGIQTDLKYAVYKPSKWGKSDEKEKQALDLDSASGVYEGCDVNISGTIRSVAKVETCFYLTIGTQGETVTCITPTVAVKKQWLNAFREFFDRFSQNCEEIWTGQLRQKAQFDADTESIKLEDAVELLDTARRRTDKIYAKEMFNSIIKQAGLKSSSDPSLSSELFVKFLTQASHRPDIDFAVYYRLLDTQKSEKHLKAAKFHDFIVSTQKEAVPLNTAKAWIKQFEPVLPGYNLSPMGFTNFMTSEDQWLFRKEFRSVYQDMNQTLSHYFIATSHNTYLTKDQLKSKSSVDMYIQAFKRGCKCVELDCWDGSNNEPIIYHGHTLTSKIKFVDVIKAVNDYAFVVSEYPVILSFENHCSVDQQKVMAKHLVEVLGDKLYSKEIPEDEKQLPSPEALKGYVIVKNKKLKEGVDETLEDDDDFSDDDINEEEIKEMMEKKEKDEDKDDDENGNDNDEDTVSEAGSETKSKSKGIIGRLGDLKLPKRSSSKKKAAKLAPELSDLVSYCRAVPFKGFEYAKENYEHYEMSSFGEKKAFKFAKDYPMEYLNYTKRHMARSYPAGGRVDSSNYDPAYLWNVGVQLVALNYQTGSYPMQLNQGFFQDNGGCGYVLKPQFMRKGEDGSKYDPRGPFEVNEAKNLTIKVISGHQLPYKSDSHVKKERELSIQIRIAGVEADTFKAKTKTLKNNGYKPMWDEEAKFKIHVPELTLVTFTVIESNNTFLGQYTLPYRCLRQGYRYVPLQTKSSETIPKASLFVHVEAEGL